MLGFQNRRKHRYTHYWLTLYHWRRLATNLGDRMLRCRLAFHFNNFFSKNIILLYKCSCKLVYKWHRLLWKYFDGIYFVLKVPCCNRMTQFDYFYRNFAEHSEHLEMAAFLNWKYDNRPVLSPPWIFWMLIDPYPYL